MAMEDQQLPDDLEDNTYGFGAQTAGADDDDYSQSNGGHKPTAGGGSGGGGVIMADNNELKVEQKLQLAERANEIYRQQLKYMQDHLASLRSLIQDKENIIENLMLRYDLGIITQDTSRQGANLSQDEIEMEELRRKAEALAQRTILENFELREMVNELRDENFHLRNEIYELQDKINRQVLQINKLEKNASNNNNNDGNNGGYGNNGMDERAGGFDQYEEDPYADAEEEEPMDEIDDSPQPNDKLAQQGRRQSKTMDHPANSEEARLKRLERVKKHKRVDSVKPPNLFGDGDDDSDYIDDEALKIRKERQEKAHRRDPSIPIPNIYGDQQGSSEEDDGSDNDEDNGDELQLADKTPTTGTKRRGSKVFIDDEAMKKREERQKKHRRKSSVAPPPMFDEDYDEDKYAASQDQINKQKNSSSAQSKRLQRQAKKLAKSAVKHVKKHRRKESLAEKLLLTGSFEDGTDLKSADPKTRDKTVEKAKKEQRRKHSISLQQQAGLKQHFSDDDMEFDDKPQRKKKKRSKQSKQSKDDDNQLTMQDINNLQDPLLNKQPPPPQDSNKRGHKKRPSIGVMPNGMAVANEMNEMNQNEAKTTKHRRDSSAPVVALGFEDPDVLLHFEKLKVKDLEAELEKKLDELDAVRDEKVKFEQQVESAKETANDSIQQKDRVSNDLVECIDSKKKLSEKCSMEIMRLTMVLNTLLQIPKFKQTVQLLINESHKQNNKNGSLLNG